MQSVWRFQVGKFRQAYTQLPLSADSRKYCVISTHKGLYAYTRLPYGVSSVPSIWQKVLEQIVQGIDGVAVFLDDLLVGGSTQQQHDERLVQVLEHFRKYGVKVGQKKRGFNQSAVQYLGYTYRHS